MPRVALTSKAESDLDGLYEHYAPLMGAERAEAVVFSVLDSLASLEAFPQLGKASDIPDCRELILSKYPYRAVYSVQRDTLLVYRILPQHAERPEDW